MNSKKKISSFFVFVAIVLIIAGIALIYFIKENISEKSKFEVISKEERLLNSKLVKQLISKDRKLQQGALASLREMNWQPRTNEERISWCYATDDWSALKNRGLRNNPLATRLLLDALQSKVNSAQNQAVEAAGKFRIAEAVPALIALLEKHSSLSIIAKALANIGDRRAILPLFNFAIEWSNSKDIESALQQLLAGSELSFVFAEKEIKNNSAIRLLGISILTKLNKDRAVPVLLNLLHDPVPWVREAAADGLGIFCAREAERPLMTLLNDPFFWVRRSAALALGKTGDRECLNVLAGALEDKVWIVREAAAKAIENLGQKSRKSEVERSSGDSEVTLQRSPAMPAWPEIAAAINMHLAKWLALWKIDDSILFHPHRPNETININSNLGEYSLFNDNVTSEDIKDSYYKYYNYFSPDRKKCLDIGLCFSLRGNEIGAYDGRGDVDQFVILVDMVKKKAWQVLFTGPSGGYSDLFWLNNDFFIVAGWGEIRRSRSKIEYAPYISVFDSNSKKGIGYSGPRGKTIIIHVNGLNPLLQYEKMRFIPIKPQE
jgi:hypothetical protein